MTNRDDIVRQVISLSRLPGAWRRREIESELRDHIEDIAEEARSQGYDEPAVQRIVQMRFGKSHEVAAAFHCVYAPERLARCIARLAILMTASLAAVAFVIGSVQSVAAICTAASIASVFRDMRWEFLGFGAIALGYCSLYWGQRLFPASLAKAVLPSAALALWIGAALSWAAPGHVALPLVAFTSAALSRLLQRIEIPLVWLVGTAGPLFIAWALFGPLISGWKFPWLVWLSLTISCKVLQEIVQLFERFIFAESFV